MNSKSEFAITLNFQFGIQPTQLNKLKFSNIVSELLYLEPYQWELGLQKLITPNSRLIPFPGIGINLYHGAYIADDDDMSWSHNLSFAFPTQTKSTIQEYVEDISDRTFRAIKGDGRFFRFPKYEFKISIIDGKINISDLVFANLPANSIQVSHISFYGIDQWRKLGFHQLRSELDQFPLPFQAFSVPFLETNSTLMLTAPNLIEPQLVSDTYKPILELIPFDSTTTGNFIDFSPINVIYKRLIGGYISQIDLELEDLEESEIITLRPESFQVVLHFRKCQP